MLNKHRVREKQQFTNHYNSMMGFLFLYVVTGVAEV